MCTVAMSAKQEIKGMEYGPPDHRKKGSNPKFTFFNILMT